MLARNIKKARREKGVSQTELGKIIGVSHSTIAGYESGHSKPDANKLAAIAKELGVTMEQLMGVISMPDGEIDARTPEERNHDIAMETLLKQQETIAKQQETIAKLVDMLGKQ